MSPKYSQYSSYAGPPVGKKKKAAPKSESLFAKAHRIMLNKAKRRLAAARKEVERLNALTHSGDLDALLKGPKKKK